MEGKLDKKKLVFTIKRYTYIYIESWGQIH